MCADILAESSSSSSSSSEEEEEREEEEEEEEEGAGSAEGNRKSGGKAKKESRRECRRRENFSALASGNELRRLRVAGVRARGGEEVGAEDARLQEVFDAAFLKAAASTANDIHYWKGVCSTLLACMDDNNTILPREGEDRVRELASKLERCGDDETGQIVFEAKSALEDIIG